MIAFLSGKIINKKPHVVILDVNGVGYEVYTSMHTHFMMANEGQSESLYIQMIVREDAITLYGFKQTSEQKVFISLLKVNGIGPKSALAILSSVTPTMLLTILHQKDINRLVKLPGIGKKTAERLLIEMGDSLPKALEGEVLDDEELSIDKQNLHIAHDAIQALVALGYKETQAKKMIDAVDDGTKNADILIRDALKQSIKV